VCFFLVRLRWSKDIGTILRRETLWNLNLLGRAFLKSNFCFKLKAENKWRPKIKFSREKILRFWKMSEKWFSEWGLLRIFFSLRRFLEGLLCRIINIVIKNSFGPVSFNINLSAKKEFFQVSCLKKNFFPNFRSENGTLQRKFKIWALFIISMRKMAIFPTNCLFKNYNFRLLSLEHFPQIYWFAISAFHARENSRYKRMRPYSFKKIKKKKNMLFI